MATTLYPLLGAATVHRGTNTAKLNGSASGWQPQALSTTAPPVGGAAAQADTVTGPTNGIEVGQGVGGGSPPAEWISEPVAADVTISGTITANITVSESSMTANVAMNIVVDIIRSDASNTIVQIVKSTRVTEESTSDTAISFTTGMTSGAYTGQTLNRGDRLRIRVFGGDAGTMAATFFFSFNYGGAGGFLSSITFTENITFENAPGTAVISSTDTANPQGIGATSSSTQVAWGFTAQGTLTEVRAMLYKAGAPTDNLVLEIQTDSAGAPSGSVVGTVATVGGASLTTTATEYTYSASISLTASTTYWLVMRRSGAVDLSNAYQARYATAGSFPSGYAGHLRFDGSSWVSLGGTGAAVASRLTFATGGTTTLYLTDTASDVATASVDREAWTSRGGGVVNDVTNTAAGFTTPIQVTDTAGGTVVDWFTRPLTAFTLTGMAQANIRALESATAANASLRVEIARVEGDGSSPTVWASWCMSADNTRTGELNTSETAETINISGDDLAITDGQRLRIRLYLDDMPTTAMAASQTVTTYYGGTSDAASGDSYITFPLTLTEFEIIPASIGFLKTL